MEENDPENVRTMYKGILLSILDTGHHLISVTRDFIDMVLKKQTSFIPKCILQATW
jgi:hypothetical protein